MPFQDYCAELKGTIPSLPYPLAQKLVNRAWRQIQDMRLWSWLVGDGDLRSADLISAGTITVTDGSPQATADATAAAALNAVAFSNPPLASPDLGVGRQIRFGAGEDVYSIVAWDNNTQTLTLDRPYLGASGSKTYQVYKCYYAPPDSDFLRYLSVRNTSSGYVIRRRRLYVSQEVLNAVDPKRGARGEPYILSPYRSDSRPVHEFYPHPISSRVYRCYYVRRGKDLSDTVDLPSTFSESVLISLALIHAADWALANVSTYPDLAQTNWVQFRAAKQQAFNEEIRNAMRQDDEVFPYPAFRQTLAADFVDFPLGGEFAQSHDLSQMLGLLY